MLFRSAEPGASSTIPAGVGARARELGSGQPLSGPWAGRARDAWGVDVGHARIHSGTEAAGMVARARARAVTIGSDVFFGAGKYRPETLEGGALLAHELAHVGQQRLVGEAQRDLESDADQAAGALLLGERRQLKPSGGLRIQGCSLDPASFPERKAPRRRPPGEEPAGFSPLSADDQAVVNWATAILDPELDTGPAAPGHASHVAARGLEGPATYVHIEAPVLSTRRLVVGAVPLYALFKTEEEAGRTFMTDPKRVAPSPSPGDVLHGWAGPVTVAGVSKGYALTTADVPEAVGSAVVLWVETTRGYVVVDLGLDGADNLPKAAMAYQVVAEMQAAGITEVPDLVFGPQTSSGFVAGTIGEYFPVARVHLTEEQAEEQAAVLEQIEREQLEIREEDLIAEGARIDATRESWEATQPMSTNLSIREERWQRYRAAQLSRFEAIPDAELYFLDSADDNISLARSRAAYRDAPEEMDLTTHEFEDVSEDGWIFVLGDGKVAPIPLASLARRPMQSTAPIEVAGLRPSVPTGQGRAPSLAVPAVSRGGLFVVRTSQGSGVLFDASGFNASTKGQHALDTGHRNFVATMETLNELTARAGISNIERLVLTHPHEDHIRWLREILIDQQIPKDRLVVMESWAEHWVFRDLATTTEPRLVALGYGPTHADAVRFEPTTVLEHLRTTDALPEAGREALLERYAELMAQGEGLSGEITGETRAQVGEMAELLHQELSAVRDLLPEGAREAVDVELARLERLRVNARDFAIPHTTTGEVTTTRITLESGRELTVYSRDTPQFEAERSLRRSSNAGGKVMDSSGPLTVLESQSSNNHTAVIHDHRGADLTAFREELGPELFREAMRDVAVVKGFGHHFSTATGKTRGSVVGLQQFLYDTVVQNGRLTVVVQTDVNFAFNGNRPAGGVQTAQAMTVPNALVQFLTRMGVRVVVVEGASADRGGVTIDSLGNLQEHGTGVTVYEPEPRSVLFLDRVARLEAAIRILTTDPTHGPHRLGLEGTAEELRTGLESELRTLRESFGGRLVEGRNGTMTLEGGLLGQGASELMDVRGTMADSTKNRFRGRQVADGATVDSLYDAMAQQGEIESRFSEEALRELNREVAVARGPALRAEVARVPTAILEMMEARADISARLVEEIARNYDQIGERVPEGELVPRELAPEITERVLSLVRDLERVRDLLPEAKRAPIEAELARLRGVSEQLGMETVTENTYGRTAEGFESETTVRRAIPLVQAGDRALMRGAHIVGQGFGAIMIAHSVKGLIDTAGEVQAERMSIPEGALRAGQSAYGLNIGVRMLNHSFAEAAAGRGGVRPWEFVILAAIDITATAAGDYESSEARDAAIVTSGINNAVHLACFAAGQGIMGYGAAMPVFTPQQLLIKAGVMGVGLAVTMAGGTVLEWLSLDDDVERWTSFAPSEVTEVHQNIGALLRRYSLAAGARQLAARDVEDLEQLGIAQAADAHSRAKEVRAGAAESLEDLEELLLESFKDGYEAAREDHVGLRALDVLAARFARLRLQALGDDAPGRAELEEIWEGIDENLSLKNESEEWIRDMEQWDDLRDKLDEVQESIEDRDTAGILENVGEANQMLQNARYRLDPASQGGMRVAALLERDAANPAPYDAYVELLDEMSSRLSAMMPAAMGLAYDSDIESAVGLADLSAEDALTPLGALAHLRVAHSAYRKLLKRAKDHYLDLDDRVIWRDPAALARAVENVNNEGTYLPDIQMAELLLETTIMQAESVRLTAGEMDRHDEAAIEREIRLAREEMGRRIYSYGLIFRSELDGVLAERLETHDARLALEIDQAVPPAGAEYTQPVRGLTPQEEAFLADPHAVGVPTDMSVFGEEGERYFAGSVTTRQALRDMRQATEAHRSWSSGELDYERMNRIVDRTFYFLANPYTYADEGWIVTFNEASYSDDLAPLVVGVPGHVLGSASNISLRTAHYHGVMAVNADARRAIGSGTVLVRGDQLLRVTREELREMGQIDE